MDRQGGYICKDRQEDIVAIDKEDICRDRQGGYICRDRQGEYM